MTRHFARDGAVKTIGPGTWSGTRIRRLLVEGWREVAPEDTRRRARRDSQRVPRPGHVVVIGNGPSAGEGGLGEEIDKFRTVIRLNCFEIDGYEKHVGTRTDIWAVNLAEHDTLPKIIARADKPDQIGRFLIVLPAPEREADQLGHFASRFARLLNIIDALYPGVPVEWIPSEFAADLRDKIGAQPTLGLTVIAWLLHLGYRPALHGFDILKGADCEPRDYWGADSNLCEVHNPDAEAGYLNPYGMMGQLQVTHRAAAIFAAEGSNDPAVDRMDLYLTKPKDTGSPLAVAYFTRGYESEADRLRNSLQSLEIDHRIVRLPLDGSWRQAAHMRPAFLQDMRSRYPGRPMLSLDADAEVLANPLPAMANLKGDVGVHHLSSRTRLPGTMWLRPTPATDRFLSRWAALNRAYPGARDIVTCNRAIIDTRGLVVDKLKPAYCWIADKFVDKYPNSKPVIVQHQASRTHRAENS